MNFPENYITDLYDWANRPEILVVRPEAEMDRDQNGHYVLHCEVEETVKNKRNKRAKGDAGVFTGVLKLLFQ
jgi:hypothetical protein